MNFRRAALTALLGIVLAAPLLADITVTPSQPNVDQTAAFSVSRSFMTVLDSTVQWNFGDGLTASGSHLASHAYSAPGTYSVTCRYFAQSATGAGAWFTDALNLTVVEARRITYSPASPLAGQPVTFTALNFLSMGLQWDFGDGTAPVLGTTTITHTFVSPGVFAVKAGDAGGGGSSITTLITIGTSTGEITIVPALPNVDEAATMIVSRSYYVVTPGSVQWSFGDGSTAAGSATVQKTYAATGTYSVTVRYTAAPAAGGTAIAFTDGKSVTVGERRRITFAPASPMVQQTVMMTAQSFFSAGVRWDFGDGTPAVTGGTEIAHIYQTPGPFTVKAKDFGGAAPGTVTAFLNVGLDITRRQIVYAPRNAVPRQPITFSARNFYTTDIRWDFGDGSNPVSGNTTAVHVFAGTGTFLVKAWDWGGRAGDPTIVPVTIGPEIGPRAPFRIFVLQMRFEDGLAYKIVSRGAAGLTAFADIKYEGTGMFEAQWTVDGMPFRPVTRTLPFAQSTTLDTGRVPALPTTAPGLHEVGLRIVQPDIDFTVPVIRYYVVAGGVAPRLQPVRIEVKTAEGLKGVSCSLVLDTLKVRTGSYFILNGTVRHDLDSPVRFGLLRIHLDEALVDQQLIRNLEPGRDRPFVTSILVPPAGAKTLYVSLYDITDNQAPRLLYIKKITVLPERD